MRTPSNKFSSLFNIGKFIDDLINSGFNVSFDSIENKNGKYYTSIRIEE